jgi:hypothetical protein
MVSDKALNALSRGVYFLLAGLLWDVFSYINPLFGHYQKFNAILNILIGA